MVELYTQEKTFSGYLTRSVVRFATCHGVDVEKMCATIGFDLTLLDIPDRHIPQSLHYRICQEVSKQMDDENLGLHVGETFNLAYYGIVGYILINCPTLEDVFKKFSHYAPLFFQGVLTDISVINGMAIFDCNSISELSSDRDIENSRYDTESIFAAILTAVKALTGKIFYPSAVFFQHSSPADLAEYQRIFQSDLKFSMPYNRMVFDAACLRWPILSSNVNLLMLFEQQAEAMLEQLNEGDRYTQKVIHIIRHYLPGELPTVDVVAAQLAISSRHLQRELKMEGTSFQKLLDHTCQELALKHLRDSTISIHDIAFLLGFSSSSAFNRAFKRWTGKTPSSYRS